MAEVSVIGVPDAYRGEAAKAFVQLSPAPPFTLDELRAFLADKIGRHEMPRIWNSATPCRKPPLASCRRRS